MKIPLSVYDFFGYLTSGFILLLSVNIAFAQDWLFKANQNLVMGISLIRQRDLYLFIRHTTL